MKLNKKCPFNSHERSELTSILTSHFTSESSNS